MGFTVENRAKTFGAISVPILPFFDMLDLCCLDQPYHVSRLLDQAKECME
jgi:hypothetical protein